MTIVKKNIPFMHRTPCTLFYLIRTIFTFSPCTNLLKLL